MSKIKTPQQNQSSVSNTKDFDFDLQGLEQIINSNKGQQPQPQQQPQNKSWLQKVVDDTYNVGKAVYDEAAQAGKNLGTPGKRTEGAIEAASSLLHGTMLPFTVPLTAATSAIKEAGKNVEYTDPLTGAKSNLGEDITGPVDQLMNLPFDALRQGSELTDKGLNAAGVNTKKIDSVIMGSPEAASKLNNLVIELGGIAALGKLHKGANKIVDQRVGQKINVLPDNSPNILEVPEVKQLKEGTAFVGDQYGNVRPQTERIGTDKGRAYSENELAQMALEKDNINRQMEEVASSIKSIDAGYQKIKGQPNVKEIRSQLAKRKRELINKRNELDIRQSELSNTLEQVGYGQEGTTFGGYLPEYTQDKTASGTINLSPEDLTGINTPDNVNFATTGIDSKVVSTTSKGKQHTTYKPGISQESGSPVEPGVTADQSAGQNLVFANDKINLNPLIDIMQYAIDNDKINEADQYLRNIARNRVNANGENMEDLLNRAYVEAIPYLKEREEIPSSKALNPKQELLNEGITKEDTETAQGNQENIPAEELKPTTDQGLSGEDIQNGQGLIEQGNANINNDNINSETAIPKSEQAVTDQLSNRIESIKDQLISLRNDYSTSDSASKRRKLTDAKNLERELRRLGINISVKAQQGKMSVDLDGKTLRAKGVKRNPEDMPVYEETAKQKFEEMPDGGETQIAGIEALNDMDMIQDITPLTPKQTNKAIADIREDGGRELSPEAMQLRQSLERARQEGVEVPVDRKTGRVRANISADEINSLIDQKIEERARGQEGGDTSFEFGGNTRGNDGIVTLYHGSNKPLPVDEIMTERPNSRTGAKGFGFYLTNKTNAERYAIKEAKKRGGDKTVNEFKVRPGNYKEVTLDEISNISKEKYNKYAKEGIDGLHARTPEHLIGKYGDDPYYEFVLFNKDKLIDKSPKENESIVEHFATSKQSEFGEQLSLGGETSKAQMPETGLYKNKTDKSEETPLFQQPEGEVKGQAQMFEQGKAKEPWQMTKEEYLEQEKAKEEEWKKHIQKIIDDGTKIPESDKVRQDENYQQFQTAMDRTFNWDHKGFVKQALKESKPVPEEVLKGYPELMPEDASLNLKEPWQMTRDEFVTAQQHKAMRAAEAKNENVESLALRKLAILSAQEGDFITPHREAIKQAIKENKAIPENVLEDYPDLKPETKARTIDDIKFSIEDIPYQTAYNAHTGTSFSPEKRAVSEQEDYISHLSSVKEELTKLAKTEEQQAIIADEFERYIDGYKKRKLDILRAESNTYSSMIAGPSNFPTRTMEKRNNAIRNKYNELGEWEEKAINSIKKKLRDKQTEEAGGELAAMEKKLADAKSNHELMKKSNIIVKSKNLSSEQKISKLVELGYTERQAKEVLQPDYMGRTGYAPFSLTNSLANIKRMEQRVIDLRKRKEATGTETKTEYEGAKIVNNNDVERVQILFDTIPDAKVREELKSRGFRWSPRERAWQRKNTNQGLRDAEQILNNHFKVKENEAKQTPPERSRFVSEEAYKQAVQNLNQNVDKLFSGLDPVAAGRTLRDLTVVGAYHIENGLNSFAKWSKKMVEQFGDSVIPYLKRVWEESHKTDQEPLTASGLKKPYNPAILTKDGTVYFHGEAVNHGDLINRLRDQDVIDDNFNYNNIKSSGALDVDGNFYDAHTIKDVPTTLIGAYKRFISDDDYKKAGEALFANNSKSFTGEGKIKGTLELTKDNLKALSTIGAYHLENVIRSGIEKAKQLKAWSDSMVKEFGQKIRNYLMPIWQEVKKYATGDKAILSPDSLGMNGGGTSGKSFNNRFNPAQIDDAVLSAKRILSDMNGRNVPDADKFRLFTSRMIKDQGEGVKPYIRKIFEDVNNSSSSNAAASNNIKPDFKTVLENKISDEEYEKYAQMRSKQDSFKGQILDKVTKAKEYGKSAVSVYEKGLKSKDRIIAEVSTKLYQKLVRYDQNTEKLIKSRMEVLGGFLQGVSKFSKEDKYQLELAMFNSDGKKLTDLFNKYGITEEHKKLREILDDLGKLSGLETTEFYFPRQLKNYGEFLKKFQDLQNRNIFDKLIEDKENKYGKLSDEQKFTLIDNALRGYNKGITLSKLGAEKERIIKILDTELAQNYYDPFTSLSRHILEMTDMQEARRFFGKIKDADSKSIGQLITENIEDEGLNYEQSNKLRNALQARFQSARSPKIITGIKKLAYIEKLAQINTSVNQLKDLSVSLYRNGTPATVKALYEVVTGKKAVSLGDLGIMEDKIAQELSDPSRLNKILDDSMKWAGFTKFDSLGKETFINAYMKRYRNEAIKNSKLLNERLDKLFSPEEKAKVIEDLKQGKVSDDVSLLLFSELSKTQPISKSALPIGYDTAPVMRIFYTFRTFAVRRLNFWIEETAQQYKAGNKAQAMKNFLRLGLYSSLLGASVDTITNIMLGRKLSEDELEETLIYNMMDALNVNRYMVNRFGQQQFSDAMSSILTKLPLPLVDNVYADMKGLVKDGKYKFNLVKSVPIAGRPVYEHFIREDKKTKNDSGSASSFHYRQRQRSR